MWNHDLEPCNPTSKVFTMPFFRLDEPLHQVWDPGSKWKAGRCWDRPLQP